MDTPKVENEAAAAGTKPGVGVIIGTHSGAFQADEALGVWMLRRLDQFGGLNAPVVRSRDVKVLEPLTIVIDVAGVYDHKLLRYDHHQRGFFGAQRSFDAPSPHRAGV